MSAVIDAYFTPLVAMQLIIRAFRRATACRCLAAAAAATVVPFALPDFACFSYL